MRVIAIIPARSGSKGLVDKNIREFNGKPLISYTITAALSSGLFDEVHVSTDSEQYANISKEYGANVPFLRDALISTDQANSWDVVKYVLNQYKAIGKCFDVVCLLQPTSPLRSSWHILEAFNQFKEKKANSIVSVCEAEHSPLWMNTLPKNGSMDNFIRKELVETPRQDLQKFYRINGAIYITKVDDLMKNATIYDNGCFAYIMEKIFSIDIDDITDFIFAELLQKLLKDKANYLK